LDGQLIDHPSGVYYVDTFQVEVETVRIDVPSTKNQPHVMVGYYDDPTFGRIKAQAFTQLGFNGIDTLRLGSDVSIDSIVSYMISDFYVGDISEPVTKPMSFSVYKLQEIIDSTKARDYTSAALPYSDTLIARFDGFDFDQTIVNKYKLSNEDSDTTHFHEISSLFKQFNGYTNQAFLTEFKGLAFIPDSSKTSFALGFRVGGGSSFNTVIYYHYFSDATNTVYYYTLSPLSGNSSLNDSTICQRYTKLDYKPIAPLDQLVGFDSVPSSKMQGQGFMNDMLGIRTRLKFPTLANFLASVKGQYNIMDARIVIPPVDSTYTINAYTQPVPYMKLFECDPSGHPVKNGTANADGTFYQVVQNEVYTSPTTGAYSPADMTANTNNLYYRYDYLQYNRFYYPLTLYMKDIQKGLKPNNPFIASINSVFYFGGNNNGTYSPLGYSFFDRSRSRGIQLIVYLNK
jgi:hypothetical protein